MFHLLPKKRLKLAEKTNILSVNLAFATRSTPITPFRLALLRSLPSIISITFKHARQLDLIYYLGVLRLLWYNIPMEGQIDIKHMKKAEKKHSAFQSSPL